MMETKTKDLASGDTKPNSERRNLRNKKSETIEEKKIFRPTKVPSKSGNLKPKTKKLRPKLTEKSKSKDPLQTSGDAIKDEEAQPKKNIKKPIRKKAGVPSSLELRTGGKTIKVNLNEKVLKALLSEVSASLKSPKKSKTVVKKRKSSGIVGDSLPETNEASAEKPGRASKSSLLKRNTKGLKKNEGKKISETNEGNNKSAGKSTASLTRKSAKKSRSKLKEVTQSKTTMTSANLKNKMLRENKHDLKCAYIEKEKKIMEDRRRKQQFGCYKCRHFYPQQKPRAQINYRLFQNVWFCQYCDKTFLNYLNFKSHELTHTFDEYLQTYTIPTKPRYYMFL